MRRAWKEGRLGRWLTQVRMEQMLGGESPYGYAFDNPTTYVDPAGDAPQKLTGNSKRSRPNFLGCREGAACVPLLVRYSGHGQFSGAYTECFHKHPEWRDAALTCACKYGVSPLALIATMYVETHYGVSGGKIERCYDPVGVHFCEGRKLTGMQKLRHPDGTLPTLEESICAAASTLARDRRFKPGVFGATPKLAQDHQDQYENFFGLCAQRGLLG